MHTFFIILATIFWGGSYLFIKLALQELTTTQFLFLRFGIATLVMLPGCYFQKRMLKPQDFQQGVPLGIILIGTMFFQTVGLETVSASLGALLMGTSIVFVLLINFLRKRRLPAWQDLAVTLLCLVGLVLTTHSQGSIWRIGTLYVLSGAFCVGLHVHGTEKYIKEEGHAFYLTWVQLLVLAIFAGLSLLLSDEGLPWPTQVSTWWGVGAAAVLCSCASYGLITYAQRYVNSFRVATILILEPVFATLFSWLFLDEQLHRTFYLGAGLILIALLLANRRIHTQGNTSD